MSNALIRLNAEVDRSGVGMSEPCKHWFEGMVARSETECPFCRYEQAERDRDEAVRLLRKARKMWVDDDSITAEEIDAYLAK